MFSFKEHIDSQVKGVKYSEIRWVDDGTTGIIDFTSQEKSTFGFFITALNCRNAATVISNKQNTVIFNNYSLVSNAGSFYYIIWGTRFYLSSTALNFGVQYQVIYGDK